jgi:2-C-methyl-D-erythritol 4-phosphate cytidylyltransferase
VLVHSLAAFEDCPRLRGYVVVVNRQRLSDARRLLLAEGLPRLLAVVPGGKERADSVEAGLRALPAKGIVAVHDAARPVITGEMLAAGFAACSRHRAVTYGWPVSDTLKSVRGSSIIATVDRSGLVAVQTPQFFDLALLRRAHAAARRARVSATDDCALVERLGVTPVWIPGPKTNIKITTADDLRLVEALK